MEKKKEFMTALIKNIKYALLSFVHYSDYLEGFPNP